VLGPLAERFDVIAVDLPGHGESRPLPAHVEPSPAVLASAVAGLLDELDVTTPHVAGNSLGGWVALELAAVRPVASVALLSPAGLWRGRTPVFNRVSLRVIRTLARYAFGPLCRLVRVPAGPPPRFRADPGPAGPLHAGLRAPGGAGDGHLPRVRRHHGGHRAAPVRGRARRRTRSGRWTGAVTCRWATTPAP
jgi:pimeloyl-ACP methyl ester carboxylesterase